MTDIVPLPRWLCVCIALMLAVFADVAIAQDSALSRSEAATLAACKKMSGTYAVMPLPGSEHYADAVTEITRDNYVIGQPVFTLSMGTTGATRTGILSGNVTQLTLPAHVPSEHVFGDGNITCALSNVGYTDLQQIRVRNLSQQDQQALARYLGEIWRTGVDPDNLRSIRDFLVIDASMTGVMNLYLVLPLRKL